MAYKKFNRATSNKERCDFYRQILPLAFRAWVDRLNCSESIARQPCTLSFMEVLGLFEHEHGLHWTVIYRPERMGQLDHWEFAVSTLARQGEDYFLWMQVSMDVADQIFKENADVFE
jgi:hypothetical protein